MEPGGGVCGDVALHGDPAQPNSPGRGGPVEARSSRGADQSGVPGAQNAPALGSRIQSWRPVPTEPSNSG